MSDKNDFILDPYTPSRAIADCYRVGQSIIRSQVQSLEVEPAQADCVLLVINNPGITQIELSEKLFISQAATARMVRVLCEKKMLKRTRDENDNRIWHVYLGSEGELIESKILDVFHDVVSIHEEALNTEERKEFKRLIIKMLGHLVEVSSKHVDESGKRNG